MTTYISKINNLTKDVELTHLESGSKQSFTIPDTHDTKELMMQYIADKSHSHDSKCQKKLPMSKAVLYSILGVLTAETIALVILTMRLM